MLMVETVTEGFVEWVNEAPIEKLQNMRSELETRIQMVWDGDGAMARNRFEAHDGLVQKVRLINGRIRELTV